MKNDIRLLPISQIKIGKRHRKALGDLDSLAASIEKGLLQPIGVTPEMDLIWGYRRLLATRDILKRQEIPCRIVSVVSIAQGEFDENMMRKDFAPSERVAIIDTLRGYAHGGDRKSDQGRNCDVDRLTTKDAAGRVGFCRDDYFRARKVVEAANQDPERFAHLVERMDRTGRVAGAYRELKIAQEAEKIRREPEPLPQGPFRVGVIDPPWQYQDESYSLSRRGIEPYPVMSVEEIKALPVPDIMHPDSLLWMWTTNRHLVGGEATENPQALGLSPGDPADLGQGAGGDGSVAAGSDRTRNPRRAGQARSAPDAGKHSAACAMHRHLLHETRRFLRTSRAALPRFQGRDLRPASPNGLDDLGE